MQNEVRSLRAQVARMKKQMAHRRISRRSGHPEQQPPPRAQPSAFAFRPKATFRENVERGAANIKRARDKHRFESAVHIARKTLGVIERLRHNGRILSYSKKIQLKNQIVAAERLSKAADHAMATAAEENARSDALMHKVWAARGAARKVSKTTPKKALHPSKKKKKKSKNLLGNLSRARKDVKEGEQDSSKTPTI